MYTDFYGLTDKPFQLTPDARFYFDSRTHKKAMAYLGYGLAQGEGFIVVTGDIGAGKSTLVAHLMATIDRARLNAISLVSTQVEGDDMLRLVAQGLGLRTAGTSKAQLLDLVEGALNESARSGKRTLLVVDEAQNLPVSALEELRMLSNFNAGGRALIQIFLLGQPEFRDQLATSERLEQLRQRVIASHHLDPMEAGEVGAYLEHRLALAGGTGRPRFDDGACEAIFRHTDGVPRRINQLASRVLLMGALDGLDAIDAATVETVAADMGEAGHVPSRPEPRVLPLRSGLPPLEGTAEAPALKAPAPADSAHNAALERRVAALEEQLVTQEAALRRVLTLLVDWVESEPHGQRHRAA